MHLYRRRRLCLMTTMLALVAFAGCGSKAPNSSSTDSVPPPATPTIATISATPADRTAVRGSTVQLTATATNSDGTDERWDLKRHLVHVRKRRRHGQRQRSRDGGGRGHIEHQCQSWLRLGLRRLHGDRARVRHLGLDRGDPRKRYHQQELNAAVHRHGNVQRRYDGQRHGEWGLDIFRAGHETAVKRNRPSYVGDPRQSTGYAICY